MIAQIDDFDPNAVAAAAGGGGDGNASFSPYASGDIGPGDEALDLLGNLPGFPFELGVNQEEFAVGTGGAQSVTARTQVEPVGLTPGDTGVISGTFDGGFEDALPNQHLGAVDAANEFKTQVVVTFEPVDNEILESFTVEGIPLDVQIFIRPLDGAADGSEDIPQPHSGAVTVPAVLLNSIFLIAPEDSDVDIPLTFIALVSDPADPTGPVELTGEFTVVIDAAADVPTLDLIGHDGDGEGEVLTSETFGIDLDVRSNDIDDSESLSVRLFFSSSDGFDAAAVDVLATGAFLVVPTDGSEPYWEVPSESLSGLQVVLPDGTQGTVDVTVVGVATETTLSGAELTTENNVAVTEGVTFRVVVDLVPEAVDDRAVTDEDVAVVIPVLSNDDQGDGPATVVSTTDPANGSVSINSDGTVTFTPDPDFSGETTFDYTIADQDGDRSTATVTVVVNAIPDAPEPLLEEVYEAGLADGSQAGPVTTVVSGDLSALIDFGADGKGEVTQVVVDGEATAHTADGNGVITISGAFWTLTVTASGPDAGAYIFTLDDNTTHAQPAEDDSLVLPRITATISDSSGDTVEAAHDVTVFDDGPSVAVTATNESGTVLATQDAETEGGLSDSDSSTANFSGVFSVSADGGADGAAEHGDDLRAVAGQRVQRGRSLGSDDRRRCDQPL